MSLNKSEALSMAKQYVLQRNVRAAIDIYREIIEADPTDLTAINTLGDLYATTGLVQDATAQFSRVADSYIEIGLTRKAIATLKKIIAADPSNTETAIKLADMYVQAGLPSEAHQHYLQIAGAYTRKGETREALRIFGKIVDLDPSNPSTRIKLGELYLCERMHDQAYEAFVTAADQLTNKGEIRRALNAYKEALSIRPDSSVTLEAVYKLNMILGADPDKMLRGPALQSTASGSLADEISSRLTASDLQPAPTPLHHRPESSDDLFVVQETSKAERLVAFGQVDRAISMLNDVLTNKPDNIDVHIKLKDICLRTGMMAEAAHECSELARIYQARGDDDRARDYAARANRLIQLIERPSGDLQKLKHKPVEDAAPRASVAPMKLAPPREPEPKSRQITGQLDADPAQPARIILSVVPTTAISTEAATIAEDLPPALHADHVEPPPSVSEVKLENNFSADAKLDDDLSADAKLENDFSAVTKLENDFSAEAKRENDFSTEAKLEEDFSAEAKLENDFSAVAKLDDDFSTEAKLEGDVSLEPALDQSTSSSTDAIALALPSLSGYGLPVERSRGCRTAAALAATVLVLSLAGAVIGGFSYNSHLDKQYQALATATPALVEPPLLPEAVSESEPIQESEPITVDVTASLQEETSPRLQKPEPEVARNERPAPPQPTSEPAKVVTHSAPLPPRIAVNTDSQAFTENRTPAGLAGDVPVTAAHPAEPPPKAVRRSAGIVSGVAVKKVDPVYPKAAREALQTGVVTVEVTINEQGNVTSARAVSGPTLLRNAAVFAARAWKFKPSMLGDVPVTTVSTITFNFKL